MKDKPVLWKDALKDTLKFLTYVIVGQVVAWLLLSWLGVL